MPARPARRRLPPADPAAGPPRVASVDSTRLWVGLYGGIFLIAQVVLFLAFQTVGGDSRLRREMLQRAEAAALAGRHEEQLKVLLAFGERWPGAYQSGDFQKRLGDAHAALAQPRQAAEHYATAASLAPNQPGVLAAAGEQWRLAGEDDLALEAFAQELTQADPQNPMAHHRLGLAAAQQGRWAAAMRHYAALPEDWQLRAEWKPVLEQVARLAGG